MKKRVTTYSKNITYQRKGKTITYTREYKSKYGFHIRVVKRGNKSYAYREYKVNGKTVRRRIKNVVKNGKITQYGKEWLKEYSKDLDFSDKNMLEDKILAAERHGDTLTTESIMSRMRTDKTNRYIYNMGGEPEDIARDLGVSEEDVLNAQNWDFDTGILEIDGRRYKFTFDYASHSMQWKEI